MKFNENLAHIFPFDEERIMLDINTGLVHSLDKLTYAFVELWKESGAELERVPGLAAGLDQAAGLSQESRSLLRDADPAELREIEQALASLIEEGGLMAQAPELEGFAMPRDLSLIHI